MAAAEDLGRYFRIPPDLRDLNYGKFIETGEKKITLAGDYNSHNTERLDLSGMKSMLLRLDQVNKLRDGKQADFDE